MRKIPIIILSILVIASLLTEMLLAESRGLQIKGKSGESHFLYKDFHALVIGVGDYTNGWPDLPGALKDAEEVASALKEMGFEVKLVTDPNAMQLRSVLQDVAFEIGLEPDRALIFYFAGHGETLGLADGTDLGYIIPSDCPIKDQDYKGFDSKAVSMKELETLALKVKSKHFLMLFDSCFSGSLFNLVRAAPKDVSEKSARPVRQFITAGGAGEQVPDKSIFKIVFIDGIKGDADFNKDGYVTGSELGMYIQTNVINYSRGGQHPQYGKINNPKLDKGDFVFSVSEIQDLAPTSRPSSQSGKGYAEQTAKRNHIQLASIPKKSKWKLYDTFDGDKINTKLWRIELDENAKPEIKKTHFGAKNGKLFISGDYGTKDPSRRVYLSPRVQSGYTLINVKFRVVELVGSASICAEINWDDNKQFACICSYLEPGYGDINVSWTDPLQNSKEQEIEIDIPIALRDWYDLRLEYDRQEFHFYLDNDRINTIKWKNPIDPEKKLKPELIFSFTNTQSVVLEIDELGIR